MNARSSRPPRSARCSACWRLRRRESSGWKAASSCGASSRRLARATPRRCRRAASAPGSGRRTSRRRPRCVEQRVDRGFEAGRQRRQRSQSAGGAGAVSTPVARRADDGNRRSRCLRVGIDDRCFERRLRVRVRHVQMQRMVSSGRPASERNAVAASVPVDQRHARAQDVAVGSSTTRELIVDGGEVGAQRARELASLAPVGRGLAAEVLFQIRYSAAADFSPRCLQRCDERRPAEDRRSVGIGRRERIEPGQLDQAAAARGR